MSHRCPGPRCGGTADVPADRLMCTADWRPVPKPIKNAVWREYELAPGSEAHHAAMELAIRASERSAAK